MDYSFASARARLAAAAARNPLQLAVSLMAYRLPVGGSHRSAAWRLAWFLLPENTGPATPIDTHTDAVAFLRSLSRSEVSL